MGLTGELREETGIEEREKEKETLGRRDFCKLRVLEKNLVCSGREKKIELGLDLDIKLEGEGDCDLNVEEKLILPALA